MQRNCLHCQHATTAEKVLGYRTTAMLACSHEKHTAQWIDRQCRNHKFQAQKLELLKHATNPSERVVQIEKQVRFELIPAQRGADGKIIERACNYVADFRVTFGDGRVEVIDVKGIKTKEYIIKRKLMLRVHGIQIKEV